MNWDLADYVVAGALLVGAGLAHRLMARMAGSTVYKVGAAIAVAAALLLVWSNLAVGLIGSEGNVANAMYLGVLGVGLAGAVVARFRPRGMARALFVTALAQTVVAGIALAAGLGSGTANWPWDVVMATAFFVALWVGSALLFRRASELEGATGAPPG